jgi:hypothetical protein
MRKSGYFLTEEQHDWLLRLARERSRASGQDVSRSQVLRELLNKAMDDHHVARRAADDAAIRGV